jgi:hypothetical protein
MTKYEKRKFWNDWEMAIKFFCILIGFAIFASMDAVIGWIT